MTRSYAHIMMDSNAENKPTLSRECQICIAFSKYYFMIRFDEEGQRFIDYDVDLRIWSEIPRKEVKKMVRRFVLDNPAIQSRSTTTGTFYDKVVNELELHVSSKVVQVPGVVTKSGFVNYRTFQVEEPVPKHYNFTRIEDELQEEMQVSCISQSYITTLCNKNNLQMFVLKEWLKRVLLGDNSNQVAMHLVGIPGCGKSVFAELLFCLLGDEATVIELHNISSPFGLTPIVGKKLIVIPDPPIDGLNTKRASILRMLVSGEQVTVNRKHEKAFSYAFKGNVLFHSNNTLLSSSNTPEDQSGMARRLIELPCNTAPAKRIPHLLDILKRDRLAILTWALSSNLEMSFLQHHVHGINDMLANDVQDVFTEFAVSKLRSMPDYYLRMGTMDFGNNDTLWHQYTLYCRDHDYQRVHPQSFSKLLLIALRALGVNATKKHTCTGAIIVGITFTLGEPIRRKNTEPLKELEVTPSLLTTSLPFKLLPPPLEPVEEAEELSSPPCIPCPPPEVKRRRGRPPGSKNKKAHNEAAASLNGKENQVDPEVLLPEL